MSDGAPTILIGVKLLLALLCGGLVGLERELSRKPAGLRTNALICMGSALVMITSRHIGGGAPYTDPARLVAQVITGIGFIGAGVILQSRGSVTGLTTAATIFVVAAIGIAIGDNLYAVGLLATFLTIGVLLLLRYVERLIVRRRRLYHYTFKTQDPASALSRLLAFLDRSGLRLDNFSIRDQADGEHEVSFAVVSSLEDHSRLMKNVAQLGERVHAATREETD